MSSKISIWLNLLLIATLVIVLRAERVIDHAGKFNNYTCFKTSGFSQVIIRAYHSYGAIDLDAKDNIIASNKAGLATDVYMFPCRGKDPNTQVQQLIDYLNSMKSGQSAFAYTVGTIWIDVETNPSAGCSWTQGTAASNCQFLTSIVNAIKKSGRSVGIYASHYMWNAIFGSYIACGFFVDLPIWYAHYDNKQSFDDWPLNKFGGWTEPTLKQYAGDARVCGLDVDLSFY